MKILIIGKNSQIGESLKKIIPKNWNFIATTKNDLDITIKSDLMLFCEKFKPDVIINTAAYNFVDNAQDNPNLAFSINYNAVDNIDWVANYYKSYLIHFSSAYVFDGKKNLYFENDKTNPINIYGQSKLAGENIIKKNKNSLIIRTNAIFSEFNNNFVKKILSQNNKKYQIVKDNYLSPTYAGNIANLIIFILQKYEFNINGILHYNGETNISWYNFAKLIFNIAYLKNSIKKIPNIEPIEYNSYIFNTTPRPKYSILSRDKINSIKFKNELNLIESLEQTIKNL